MRRSLLLTVAAGESGQLVIVGWVLITGRVEGLYRGVVICTVHVGGNIESGQILIRWTIRQAFLRSAHLLHATNLAASGL